MKIRTNPTATIFIFLLLFSYEATLFAQSSFEGKIIYTITYTDLPAEMKEMEAMLPMDMTIFMKGNKSRVEQNQMMGKNIVVSDLDNKNGFMEMDMGGQKIRMNISTEDFKKDENIPSSIEYLDGSKNILGYACKKAIMKNDNGDIIMTVFYTNKFKNPAQKEFIGLNGFPLSYSMSQNNMTLEMIATDISEQSVSDKIFEKSAGYKDISQADLQKMMGGGKF